MKLLGDAADRGWARVERILVVLVALHTFAVGTGLFVVPAWALRFGGWRELPPLFFPRQAGVFHFVVGIGYLVEYFRFRSVALLLTAKSLAVVFLIGAAVLAQVPWFVPFAGVADGAMAVAVWYVHRRATATPTG